MAPWLCDRIASRSTEQHTCCCAPQRPPGFEKRLQLAGSLIGGGAQSPSDQLQRIKRAQRLLLWKGAAVVVGSLLVLLGGGRWLLAHYRQQIEDNQLRAELLRAYNAADVTLCNGQLCANVETKGQAYGDTVNIGRSNRADSGGRHPMPLTPQSRGAALCAIARLSATACAGSSCGGS